MKELKEDENNTNQLDFSKGSGLALLCLVVTKVHAHLNKNRAKPFVTTGH